MKSILCLFLSIGSLLAGDAESKSKALVADSKRCLAAFECFHFAAITKGQEELSAKLLLVGYASGLRFLDGWEKGKLLEEDRKEVAMAYGFCGLGPTHDFVVGRLLQAMKEDLDAELKDVRPELWNIVTSDELRNRNAELVVDSFKPDSSASEGNDPFWNKYRQGLETIAKQLEEAKAAKEQSDSKKGDLPKD